MPPFRIPLSEVDLGPQEQEAVLRTLRSGWLSMGQETESFEKEFSQYLGCGHSLAVANGTAALHLALLAVGAGPGDAVLQPVVNFVSAANVTIAVGAEPVFVDVLAADEPTIAPADLERKLDALDRAGGPKPKAVVVMHYGGHACRMADIQAICGPRGLPIVEDACHGVGGTSAPTGRKMGNVGEIGCFSFFSNKNMITGEGGMVTTSNDELAQRVRHLRSHGMTTLTWDRHRGHAASYDVVVNGFNYRIDELRSAIGREQLKKLDANNARRRAHVQRYWKLLAGLKATGWALPFSEAGDRLGLPSAHLMPVVAPDEQVRARCAEAFRQAGIQTSLHYPFIPGFTAFAGKCRAEGLAVGRAFCRRVITLPLYPQLTESDQDDVCRCLLSAAAG